MHTKHIPHTDTYINPYTHILLQTNTNIHTQINIYTDIFKYAYTHLHLLIYTQPFIHSQ
jgi:hypothetical protein